MVVGQTGSLPPFAPTPLRPGVSCFPYTLHHFSENAQEKLPLALTDKCTTLWLTAVADVEDSELLVALYRAFPSFVPSRFVEEHKDSLLPLFFAAMALPEFPTRLHGHVAATVHNIHGHQGVLRTAQDEVYAVVGSPGTVGWCCRRGPVPHIFQIDGVLRTLDPTVGSTEFYCLRQVHLAQNLLQAMHTQVPYTANTCKNHINTA